MANLDEMAELLKVITPNKNVTSGDSTNTHGLRRRSWLANDSERKEVDRPLNEKGSINPVSKPHSSTPFINPIHQPLNQKGLIDRVDESCTLSLQKLHGNPLKITAYLYDLCNGNSNRITLETSRKKMVEELGITYDSVRTALKFLLKNKIIEREEIKVGKAGGIKYSINKTIFNELKSSYKNGNIKPLEKNLRMASVKGSISSSNINNNTTTALPPEWKEIDYEILREIGFNEHHLFDIYLPKQAEPNIVQEGIYHLAWGISEGKYKQYPNLLNVFIGKLRKGGNWFEPNYVSPKEKALKDLLARKKEENERINSIINEFVDIDFPIWRKDLSEDQIKQIVPPDVFKTKIPAAITSSLKKYFIDNIIMPKLDNNVIATNN